MTKPTLYTVARFDCEFRQYNLTLHEAARVILTDGGKDYQFRLSPDHREYRRELWVKDNNSDWRRTSIFSVQKSYSAAKANIFQQVVDKSRFGWRGLIASKQRHYCDMLERMRARAEYDPVDDADAIAAIDAELAKIDRA